MHHFIKGTISDKDKDSWVKRTPKIQSQTKMKIITWYLWLFTVIHESREHLFKADLHTGYVLRTFLKSVHIDQRIYDTIDHDRHYKWHYEYADLIRRRLSLTLPEMPRSNRPREDILLTFKLPEMSRSNRPREDILLTLKLPQTPRSYWPREDIWIVLLMVVFH